MRLREKGGYSRNLFCLSAYPPRVFLGSSQCLKIIAASTTDSISDLSAFLQMKRNLETRCSFAFQLSSDFLTSKISSTLWTIFTFVISFLSQPRLPLQRVHAFIACHVDKSFNTEHLYRWMLPQEFSETHLEFLAVELHSWSHEEEWFDFGTRVRVRVMLLMRAWRIIFLVGAVTAVRSDMRVDSCDSLNDFTLRIAQVESVYVEDLR